ncbi:MAG: DNA glycosylase [Chloroflexota bacterium]
MRQSTMSLQPPYDFGRSISFWRRSTGELCEHWADGVYRRVILLNNVPVILTLHNVGSIEAPAVGVELDGRQATTAEMKFTEAQILHILGDNLNLREFYSAVMHDPILASLTQQFYGVRAPRSPLWETLCWIIAGQQISVPFAYRLKERLVKQYSAMYNVADRPLYVFPSPTTVAQADPNDLLSMQFSRNKTSFIIGLAQHIVDGTLHLDSLGDRSTTDAIAYLTKFRGIGTWTAEFTLLRSLGRPDALPANDAGVRQGIEALYGKRLAESDLRVFASQWGSWGGMVASYLLAWLRERSEQRQKEKQ